MPNFKRTTGKVNIAEGAASGIKDGLDKVRSSGIAMYAKRQSEKKAAEKLTSERFTEYASRGGDKEKLRDINEPAPASVQAKKKLKDLFSYFKVHKSPDNRAVKKVNPKYILVLLCFICIALIVLSSVSEKVRAPFKAAASLIVVPAQKGANSIGRWVSDRVKLNQSIEELESENEALQAQIDSLIVSNTSLRQKNEELERLRNLLQMKDQYSEYESVGARVIAKNSGKWFSTFTIDKGSSDGIEKDMNVIADGGLVGIVTDVGLNFSTVRTIIDDESSVSGKFEKETDVCIVNGSLSLIDQNILEFVNVSGDVELKENMAVVTSQLSSKYLPGILIGYVSEFHTDENDLTQSGYLTPVVDFTNIEEVLVLTELKKTWDN